MQSTELVIGYRLSAIGYRLSAIGYRLSAIGYRLSAIGYRLSAIGYWLSAISFQPQARMTLDSLQFPIALPKEKNTSYFPHRKRNGDNDEKCSCTGAERDGKQPGKPGFR